MTEREIERLTRRHADVYEFGGAAPDRHAAKLERQLRMSSFVSDHGIACFKCGTTASGWAKTGIAERGPWAICLRCVRSK